MSSAFSLHDIAPRLARARDQLVAERRQARKYRAWLRNCVLDAERILAHRELQVIRGRRGKYIARRHRLVEEAKRELAYYQSALATAEQEAP